MKARNEWDVQSLGVVKMHARVQGNGVTSGIYKSPGNPGGKKIGLRDTSV